MFGQKAKLVTHICRYIIKKYSQFSKWINSCRASVYRDFTDLFSGIFLGSMLVEFSELLHDFPSLSFSSPPEMLMLITRDSVPSRL